MTRILFALCLSVFCLNGASAESINLDPLKNWIANQGEIESLICDFTQERKLRTLKKPLVADGQFWFKGPDQFRWELGKPARSVAIHSGDVLTVLDVPKKKAEVTDTSGEEDERARFAAYFDLSFPRRWDTFTENFEVLALNRVGDEWHAHVSPKSRKAMRGIKTMTFYIGVAEDNLLGFALSVKDGSTISTRFRDIKENASVPDSAFQISLDGYKVKRKRA
ncbi:MAG: outer membrane lipoprotein carrier protein LolA [Verrucomicrobiota bacterium]